MRILTIAVMREPVVKADIMRILTVSALIDCHHFLKVTLYFFFQIKEKEF